MLGCQADLAEAWRSPSEARCRYTKPTFTFYRAHLFRDHAALAEARRLIEKHGYHRRDEELADAEEAAKGW